MGQGGAAAGMANPMGQGGDLAQAALQLQAFALLGGGAGAAGAGSPNPLGLPGFGPGNVSH